MNCDELHHLTATGALGGLEAAERERLEAILETDARGRAEFSRFSAVLTALARSVPQVPPPAALREQILSRIRAPRPAVPPSLQPDLPAGIAFVREASPWLPSPLPGARYKLLSTAPAQNYAVLLIELAPGTIYPEHDHEGTEAMYVITGDLESEGRLLGPGDFIHAEPGSHHHELRSPHGCTALLVAPLSAVVAMGMAPG